MTINRARELLGKTNKNYSDNDMEYLINQFMGIAEIVTQIVGSKKTRKGIETAFRKVDD